MKLSDAGDINYKDADISKKVYFFILIFSFLWLLLIISAPLLSTRDGFLREISSYLYLFFSPVCHQEDARSFFIFGEKLGVCSRCLWIYAGFFTGTALYPLKYKLDNINTPSVIYLLIASLLLGVDVLLKWSNILQNSFITRSVTGFLIGFVLPYYLIPGFVRFFSEVNLFFKNKYMS
ncbi:MAG: DUF2085 domain-containing protein [Ignavibacteria bacterium]|nr:DUF2085 domain-containing protein [Ignavibacteria bacterium]